MPFPGQALLGNWYAGCVHFTPAAGSARMRFLGPGCSRKLWSRRGSVNLTSIRTFPTPRYVVQYGRFSGDDKDGQWLYKAALRDIFRRQAHKMCRKANTPHFYGSPEPSITPKTANSQPPAPGRDVFTQYRSLVWAKAVSDGMFFLFGRVKIRLLIKSRKRLI